ncbi:TPA: replication protein, partial [Proteus mirabilis]|nr:replication protein [Proteus mirabilis]
MSLLLLKSRPLVVIPELAVRLGLNEAMLLQQIQYWLTETTSGVEYDGSRWIYNTVEEWKNQFPFFSESTIKRAFTNLKKQGVLRIEQINKSNHDRTNYYAINYDHHLLTDEVNMTQSN